MFTDYRLVINEAGNLPTYALYRRDVLVATWDYDNMIDNVAYVREQVKLRIGGSGDDYTEETVSWPKGFPEKYPKAKAKAKRAPKAESADERSSKVSEGDVDDGQEAVQSAPEA